MREIAFDACASRSFGFGLHCRPRRIACEEGDERTLGTTQADALLLARNRVGDALGPVYSRFGYCRASRPYITARRRGERAFRRLRARSRARRRDVRESAGRVGGVRILALWRLGGEEGSSGAGPGGGHVGRALPRARHCGEREGSSTPRMGWMDGLLLYSRIVGKVWIERVVEVTMGEQTGRRGEESRGSRTVKTG